MPTATRNEHVTIGGLLMATTAIDCFDWADLTQSPEHRGGDFTVPGVPGDLPVVREAGPLQALLRIRINGKYAHSDGTSTGATEPAWRAGAYAAFQLVHDVAAVTTTQTLTLTDTDAAVSASAPCQTLSLSTDRRDTPWVWVCSLSVKVPGGTIF